MGEWVIKRQKPVGGSLRKVQVFWEYRQKDRLLPTPRILQGSVEKIILSMVLEDGQDSFVRYDGGGMGLTRKLEPGSRWEQDVFRNSSYNSRAGTQVQKVEKLAKRKFWKVLNALLKSWIFFFLDAETQWSKNAIMDFGPGKMCDYSQYGGFTGGVGNRLKGNPPDKEPWVRVIISYKEGSGSMRICFFILRCRTPWGL